MTVRNLFIEAELDTIPNVSYVHPRTVVAAPPSSADALTDEMRVAINQRVILRAFDPGAPIVTGAPIEYVTMSGEPYVTMAGEPYVTVVE